MESFLAKIGMDSMDDQDVRQMNALVLAYIGDSVYDMYVRTYIVHKQRGMVNELNKLAVGFVKAGSQAFAVRALDAFFTEEEKGMIRRGRNQKSISVPRNANMSEYRYATGFESMLGTLFLKGEKDRIQDIVVEAIHAIENREAIEEKMRLEKKDGEEDES